MKGVRIKTAQFIHPVRLFTHGPKSSVSVRQVDELDFANNTWLRITLKGKTILVPVTNISFVLTEPDVETKPSPS